jgi:Peptidase A4 family
MKSGALTRVAILSPFIILVLPVSGRAQLSLAAKQVYESAAVVPTNIDGITTFRSPPKGFDAVHAADTELALFGLPPRPDSGTDPLPYERWVRAMSGLGRRATAPLEAMRIYSRNAMPVGAPTIGAAGKPSKAYTGNWSGIANTIPGLMRWNSEKSWYFVNAEFNVPVAEQAFATGGGFVSSCHQVAELSWAGIDGFFNSPVLQGGTQSEAYCKDGVPKTEYYAWVSWPPSYPNLVPVFPVNPGDDIFVTTFDTSPTDGYVAVVDLTQNVSKQVHLKWKVGPHLVGNSAEYIVERPGGCPAEGAFCELANYVQTNWADSWASTFERGLSRNPVGFPGSTSPSTYLITMYWERLIQNISTAAAAGKYGLVFSDENCAFIGGCTYKEP